MDCKRLVDAGTDADDDADDGAAADDGTVNIMDHWQCQQQHLVEAELTRLAAQELMMVLLLLVLVQSTSWFAGAELKCHA